MKTCNKCHLPKPTDDFGKLSRSKDGKRNTCKKCVNELSRKFREEHPEHVRATYQSGYERNKERVKARAKDWSKRNPEKRRESLRKTKYATRWNVTLAYHCKSRFKDVPCEVDSDFIANLWEDQGGKCFWLGIPMVLSSVPGDPRRPSVDRKDNSRWYTKDNVVLCCQFANYGRRTSSFQSFSKFVEELKGYIRER